MTMSLLDRFVPILLPASFPRLAPIIVRALIPIGIFVRHDDRPALAPPHSRAEHVEAVRRVRLSPIRFGVSPPPRFRDIKQEPGVR